MGVGFSERGVGIAAVSRTGDAPPVLDLCAFTETPSEAGWGEALERLARGHRLTRTPCSMVVEDAVYSLLLIEAPEVPPDELRAALRWRVRDLIDFHVDDAVIDVFDVPEHRSGARAKMMYVVVARRQALESRTGIAHDAGLDLRVVDIPELAQRNVAAVLPEDVAGVALLHFTEHSGLITLTRQGVLYLARRVDTGLSSLRATLAAGGGPDAPGLEHWLDGIAVELQRSLDYYESNFAQAPIAHVVVGPLGESVPGVAAHLGAQLGVEARELDLGAIVDCEAEPDASVAAACFNAVGVALGTGGARA